MTDLISPKQRMRSFRQEGDSPKGIFGLALLCLLIALVVSAVAWTAVDAEALRQTGVISAQLDGGN